MGLIQIRPAQLEDVEKLSLIGLQAWNRSIGTLVPKQVRDAINNDNPFRPFIQTMGENILVASIDDDLAGFGAREEMDHVISVLWVAHQYEGKGVGRALIQHLEIEIKKEGYPTSKINVATENSRALGLYQHLGCRVIWQGSRFDPILQIDIHKSELEKRIL